MSLINLLGGAGNVKLGLNAGNMEFNMKIEN
jgi:hypothetical protein